jgi:hypothetical protein
MDALTLEMGKAMKSLLQNSQDALPQETRDYYTKLVEQYDENLLDGWWYAVVKCERNTKTLRDDTVVFNDDTQDAEIVCIRQEPNGGKVVLSWGTPLHIPANKYWFISKVEMNCNGVYRVL